MVAELISCSFGALFYYNTQFTLCCWEAPHWRSYVKAHTSLPVNIPLPQRKRRSGEECHTLELKSKWPGRKCFSIISREVHALHSGRSLTANESSNEPLCKTMDVWTSLHTAGVQQLSSHIRGAPTTGKHTENQYQVNWITTVSKQARELSFLNKQQNRNEFWDQSTRWLVQWHVEY